MPHRKNAKGDIGGLKRFSDTYDMDNVYLSEEGWVYRHFKNSEKTLWWDEILVAGQVKPGMVIHSVENENVVPTNPLKLGTAGNIADGSADYAAHNLVFETGDTYNDMDYSPHERAELTDPDGDTVDKITTFENEGGVEKLYNRKDFQETAWSSINVTGEKQFQPDETQVPQGWSGVSSPSDVENYGDEPPYTGEKYQSINHYTVKPDVMPGPYNGKDQPWQENSEVIVGEFADNTGPMVEDEDYIADPEGPSDAFGGGATGATGIPDPDPVPPEAEDEDGFDGAPIQQPG